MDSTLTHAEREQTTQKQDEEREQADRERNERWHANLRAEFERTCLNKDDDDLPWLVEYIADEIAYQESKTSIFHPNSYRYLVMAREVVGLELARRGLADAARLVA